MNILLLHVDYIKWEPKTKAIKQAEQVEKRVYKATNALVVFSAVEKVDEKSPDAVVSNVVKEILKVYRDVKAEEIVVYPYVHLTSTPSTPSTALYVLKQVESRLKKDGIEVKRAPFGWYKAFELKCKGHPLAELSKRIGAEEVKEEVSEALKKEEKLKSKWFVLTPAGEMHEITI